MVINCFRYLKVDSMYEVEVMPFFEYELRMRAFQYAQIDKEYYMHLQAWLNHQVKATKQVGKNKKVPLFKSFKEFYDYEKELEEIEKPRPKKLTEKQRETARRLARLNSLK